MLSGLWRRWHRRSARNHRRQLPQNRKTRRPFLEPLEERALMAVLSYGITTNHDVTLQHNGTNYEIVETGNPGNVLASQSDAVTNGVFVLGDRGREGRLSSAPPPAKPYERISRIRLSS